jgi:hypothetical protein
MFISKQWARASGRKHRHPGGKIMGASMWVVAVDKGRFERCHKARSDKLADFWLETVVG